MRPATGRTAKAPCRACWRNTSRSVSPADRLCRNARHNSIKLDTGNRAEKIMGIPNSLSHRMLDSLSLDYNRAELSPKDLGERFVSAFAFALHARMDL